MTFLVERGEGLSNSISYASIEDWMGYASHRIGFESITGENGCQPEKYVLQKYLVAASDLIDTIKWSGVRKSLHQAMEWPRCNATNSCNGNCRGVASNLIPSEIVQATIILATLISKKEINVMTNEVNPLVKRMSFEGQSIEFSTGARVGGSGSGCEGGGLQAVSGDRFSAVRHLIDCYTAKSSAYQIRLVRG